MFPCLPHGAHGCDCEAPPRVEQKLSRADYAASVLMPAGQKDREVAMLTCEHCVTLPYSAALREEARARVESGEYRLMGEHAALVKPCEEHA